MKQEFKYSKLMTIISWILFPALFLLGIWLGIMPFVMDEYDTTGKIFFILLGLAIDVVMVLGLLSIKKEKLIIEDDKITYIDLFKTKQLLLSEIKGYTVDDKYIYFETIEKKKKRIKVTKYFGNFTEIENWAASNFQDLNQIEIENDIEEILSSDEFGNTEEERSARYNLAKKVTKILGIASWVIALSFWFFPRFYTTQTVLCVLLPIIGFIVYKYFNGLIKLIDKPNSAYPNIGFALFIPSAVLLIRAITDFSIYDYSNFWGPAIAIVAVFIYFTIQDNNIKANLKKGDTYISILAMLVGSMAYAYGAILCINVTLDNSEPKIYEATILNMYVSSGKHTSYNLEISEWGPVTEVEDLTVSRDFYENCEIGAIVDMYYSAGYLNIPYYFVWE